MFLQNPSFFLQPGDELIVLLVLFAAVDTGAVASVGDEGRHVQNLGKMDPGGDLLVQPARVLKPGQQDTELE